MKKTIIASKELENLGLQQIISTLNTNEQTINRKVYYNGKISKEETTYYENEFILDLTWDNDMKYNEENKYITITI